MDIVKAHKFNIFPAKLYVVKTPQEKSVVLGKLGIGLDDWHFPEVASIQSFDHKYGIVLIAAFSKKVWGDTKKKLFIIDTIAHEATHVAQLLFGKLSNNPPDWETHAYISGWAARIFAKEIFGSD